LIDDHLQDTKPAHYRPVVTSDLKWPHPLWVEKCSLNSDVKTMWKHFFFQKPFSPQALRFLKEKNLCPTGNE
jgi:hypothetical protein